VTASWGACSTGVAGDGPSGSQFCESLKSGLLLWSIVFYVSLFISALAVVGLYLLMKQRRLRPQPDIAPSSLIRLRPDALGMKNGGRLSHRGAARSRVPLPQLA
jgi:hypothetical protein